MPQAAEYMQQHFEPALLRHWGSAKSAGEALAAAFVEVDAAFRDWHAGATGAQRLMTELMNERPGLMC